MKKHAPAVCACVLAGIFIQSAVWLRSSGIERAFSKRSGNIQAANVQTGVKEEALHAPAAGEELTAFSADALLYNPSTRVYEIHAGVDFLCPDGKVYAVLGGSVEDVYFDPIWGNTIILRHENGDQSLYASLSEASVRKGGSVKTGDIIGKSGTSAAAEEKSGPHLHFEYHKNGKSVPISFTTAPET